MTARILFAAFSRFQALGDCRFLLVGMRLKSLPVSALPSIVAVALVAVACGTSNDTAIPDPTITPVTAASSQVTAEPSPAAPVPPIATPTETTSTPTPTPEPTLYVHSSGLACYGKYSVGWEDMIDPDQAVGFPTLEEAATDWWQNASEARLWHQRDGSSSISAQDLTQSPPTSPPKGRGSAGSGINPEDQPTPPPTAIYYRDHKGNAQIVIYGYQLDNGYWIILRGESCTYIGE